VTILLSSLIGGEIVIDRVTVNVAGPLSAPHVIVMMYAAPPTPLGPVPTTNHPVALCLYSCPWKLVTTLVGAPVNEHDVPLGAVPVSAVVLKVMTSPYFPEDEERRKVRPAAWTFSGGVATE
jgi:hypothetical protein